MLPRPPRSTPFPYPPLCRSGRSQPRSATDADRRSTSATVSAAVSGSSGCTSTASACDQVASQRSSRLRTVMMIGDRKSTRLNSSHANISYAVFCLKKKNYELDDQTHIIDDCLSAGGRPDKVVPLAEEALAACGVLVAAKSVAVIVPASGVHHHDQY